MPARQPGHNKTANTMGTLFSADYLIPVTHPPIKSGAVEVADNGVILDVYQPDSPALTNREIVRHRGIIVPGFVNAHCHLELSHMKGLIPRHTGLVPFLLAVMSSRTAHRDAIEAAMEAADVQMADNGIVAVGDHANNDLSATIKRRSKIHYHTFLEAIGFEPELADQKFEAAVTLAQSFEPNAVSVTAHAPYSVSRALFKLLDDKISEQPVPLSVHNQESESENEFFRDKSGAFLDFYQALKKDVAGFTAQGKSSLQTYVPYLSASTSLLLVHNTFTAAEDMKFAVRNGRKVIWCLCPNANRYIENALPDVDQFIRNGQRIALGTDSLASNDELCILSELKTLHRHFPRLPFIETIKWATINGAEALNLSAEFGSLESGKRPGLNLLTHTDGLAITPQTSVKPLV